MGAHAVARDAAGGVGGVERRIDQTGVTLLDALRLLPGARALRRLDSGVDGDRIWIACSA
jgi:hypothetical protein